MKTNNEMIWEYITTRGLKDTSYSFYNSILQHYSQHQQATLEELITEADQEEEQRIREFSAE